MIKWDELRQALVLIANHIRAFDVNQTYEIRVLHNGKGFVSEISVEFVITHVNGNEKKIEMGPFATELQAYQAAKSKVRELIDRSNLDLFNGSRQILMYPACILS